MGILDKPSIDLFIEVIEKPFDTRVDPEVEVESITNRGLRKRNFFADFQYKYLPEDIHGEPIDQLDISIDKENSIEYTMFVNTLIQMFNKIGIILDYEGGDIGLDVLYNVYTVMVLDLEKTLSKVYLGSQQMSGVETSQFEYSEFSDTLLDVDLDFDS